MPTQFTNLLDVAIVLAAIYIALSTISSFIYEQIATLFQLRGRKLYLGIVNLVTIRSLADAIFRHPAIDTTVNDKGGIQNRPGSPNRPPYIDPHNFAVAFWDELANYIEADHPALQRAQRAVDEAAHLPPSDAATARQRAAQELLQMRTAAANNQNGTGVMSDAAHFEDLRQAVELLDAGDLKSNLLPIVALAQNDYSKLLTATEAWFNRQMGAVEGWYTRQARYAAIPIALLIVCITGLDTFELAQRLYTAPAVVSAAAGQLISAYRRPGETQQQFEDTATGILKGNDFREYFHPCLSWPEGRPCFIGDTSAWEANKTRDKAELAIAQVADDEARGRVKDDNTKIAAEGKKLDAARNAQNAAKIQTEEKATENLLKTADNDRARAETTASELFAAQTVNTQYKPFWAHLVGWFVTFIAITLGAPFWFDIANRIVNVRNAGTRPPTNPGNT